MKHIILTYYVTFGRGDYGDDMEWEEDLTDSDFALIEPFIENKSKRIDASLLEEKLPNFYNRIYESIVDYETQFFLENEDLEDWGCEEDAKDPNWRITDTYDVTIRDFCFN